MDIGTNIMIRIIADSTCNLTSKIIKKYDLKIVPLSITIKDKTYIDYVEITPDELYAQLGSLEKLPTTGSPSPNAFITVFNDDVKNGIKDFIVITMSSSTSAVNQSANIAREMFLERNEISDVRIHVVDSKSMSHGSGYLVMKTAMMAQQGVSFEALVDFNETQKVNVKHFLSVGDLDNLLKSGRLSNTSAIIGKLLKVEPIMTMKNGAGSIVAKMRGHKKVIRYYVNEFIKRVNYDLTDFIIIGYTSDVLYAENLKNLIIKNTGFTGDIYIMQMGATVGTHVGLGAVSMFFIENPKSHSKVYNGIASKIEKYRK